MAERVICNLGHAGRPDGTHISGTDALQHVPPVPVSEAEKIAELVIEKLSASVIPSSFPAYVVDMIRAATENGAYHWLYSIPLIGPACITCGWTFSPDGSVNLELRDLNGQTFWRGTFRPADG